MQRDLAKIMDRIEQAAKIQLFLDYDGTLADFAPTPDIIEPDPALIELITAVRSHPRIRVAIVSGRRLAYIKTLLPVSGMILAGTYGLEIQLPDGKEIERLEYTTIRPVMEDVKPFWAALIANRKGFFLEDKGWSLAIHALRADEKEAQMVLKEASKALTRGNYPPSIKLMGGYRFLEISPTLADKGLTIRFLEDEYLDSTALSVFIGDDDKDEAAFPVIREMGGIALRVKRPEIESLGDGFFDSPADVREFLAEIAELSHLLTS